MVRKKPIVLKGIDRKLGERFPVKLQEAAPSSDWQMILPAGEFVTRQYGKLEFTQEFLQTLVQNWRDKVLGEREPFIDSDHDWGKANGWIKDLQARADGLYAKIDWTQLGRDNLSEKLYKYFSADIGSAVDLKTGEETYPVLIGAALTNVPQMNMMPPAHLSERRRKLGGPGSGRYPAGSGGKGDSKAAADARGATNANETDASVHGGFANEAAASVKYGEAYQNINQPLDVTGDYNYDGDNEGDATFSVNNQGPLNDFPPQITDAMVETRFMYQVIDKGAIPGISSMHDVESLSVKISDLTEDTMIVNFKVTPIASIRRAAKNGEFSEKKNSHRAKKPAHSERRKALGEGGRMDKVKELITKLKALKLNEEQRAEAVTMMADEMELSEEQRVAVIDALKPEEEPAGDDDADEKDEAEVDEKDEAEVDEKDEAVQMSEVKRLRSDVKTLKVVNAGMARQLKTLVDRDVQGREDSAIRLALEKGRLLPKDEKSWRKKFRANPDMVEEILRDLPTAIDLSIRGSGDSGDLELSEDDIMAARVAKMPLEEYKKLKLAGKA
jgi:phage I-like protein